ncbi:MAG: ribose 5-phosphate isomerase B [Planctomycetaceae bacterium]|jgi:ribose 5-phosphate isomerase B|nr:ribose 5-phosphate isomerase B [Planctomycetaceae bacterium]
MEYVMKIILASDHRGMGVRAMILEYLQKMPEYSVLLVDAPSSENADYPDVAAKVAQSVASGETDRGILICGTGIGTCIVANKFPGVRAAPCHNEVVAELSRKHNNSNVLCLSGDLLGERSCIAVVEIWLTVPFEGGRHSVRLEKISQIEEANYVRR